MSNRNLVNLALAALTVLGLGGCYVYRGGYPPGGDRWWEWRYREFEDRFRPRPALRAPDLRPKSGSTFLQGDTVSIPAKVENEGDAVSGDFDVVAVVTVPGKAPQTFTTRFFSLDPGESFAPYIGGVSIAGVERPVNITVVVTADPVTPAAPRGEVWEFDEADNTRTFSYPIF